MRRSQVTETWQHLLCTACGDASGRAFPCAPIGQTNRPRGTLSSDHLCGIQVPISDDVATLTMDRFDEDEWESLLLYYHQTV